MEDLCGLGREMTVDDSCGWGIGRLLYLVIFGLGYFFNYLTAKKKKYLNLGLK